MALSAKEVLEGFQVNWTTIQDIETGEILWHSNEDYSSPKNTLEMNLPKKVLKSKAVLREVNFSSVESLENFQLVHTALYKGVVMEESCLNFGFVPKNSCLSWQSIFEAAPEAKMMNPKILSGNVEIVTKFYNNETLITTSRIRLYYV